jgi:hypothetical protein
MHQTLKHWLLRLTFGIGVVGVQSASASLGGDVQSVSLDAAELHGNVNSISLQQYDVQEITGESGLRMREFLTRDGVVFAVTWAGPVMPNLQHLLAARFTNYATGLARIAHRGLQRSVRVALPELVVESSGHLRAYSGRAYLPALIPMGISTADLR